MSPQGIALFGLGRAGSFHLASLRSLPEARLCAVYDPDEDPSAQVRAPTWRIASAISSKKKLAT